MSIINTVPTIKKESWESAVEFSKRVRQSLQQLAHLRLGIDSSPTFANLSLGTGELTCGSINRASGTLTLEIGGTAKISITSSAVTLGGNLIIPNDGYIGSVSDTDALQINSTGNVAFTQIARGIFPVAGDDIVIKEYVDLAIGSSFDLFLSNTDDGVVANTHVMYAMETDEAESTENSDALSAGDGQLAFSWLSEAGIPGTDTLREGIYDCHVHLNKNSGGATTTVYWKLSYVDADGSSNKTLVTTSETTGELTTSEAMYDIHAVVASPVPTGATKRLLFELYANIGQGQNVTVTIKMEGDHDSHISFQIPSSVWQHHGDVLDDLNTLGAVGANSEFLVGTGIGALAWENASTARTSLGVGTGDSPVFANVNVATSIIHSGDADNYINFTTNAIDFYSGGGANLIRLNSTGVWLNAQQDTFRTLISGNNEMNLVYVDAVNDRVGIGKSDPDTLLDVHGTITAEQLTSTDDITMLGHTLSLGDGTAADTFITFLGLANNATIRFFENIDEFGFGGSSLVTTGPITAEQLTSTDDITMQGHLFTLGDNTDNDITLTFDTLTQGGDLLYSATNNRFETMRPFVVKHTSGLSIDTTGIGVTANMFVVGDTGQVARLNLTTNAGAANINKVRLVNNFSNNALMLQGMGSGSWVTGLSMDSTSADITLLEQVICDKNLTVSGALKGGRCLLGMGEANTFTADRYLDYYNGQQSSATNGYVMSRAGSIVGVSCSMVITGHSANSLVQIEVRKNGSPTLTASQNMTGNGDFNWSLVESRGTDTFAAGDVLTLYVNFASTPPSYTAQDVCAMMELQFDT